jgi:hypothetical protein
MKHIPEDTDEDNVPKRLRALTLRIMNPMLLERNQDSPLVWVANGLPLTRQVWVK